MGLPVRAACPWRTCCALCFWGEAMASTPGLKIPAFSRAISSMVSPSTLVWSSPREVTPHTTGLGTMLVASSLPPSPTSRTTTSISALQKTSNATHVRKRKYPGSASTSPDSLRVSCTCQKCLLKSSIGSISPLMRILSLTSIRWGDVNNPVLYPLLLRMLSTIVHVDPLPLVPATCTTDSLDTSRSSSRTYSSMRSRVSCCSFSLCFFVTSPNNASCVSAHVLVCRPKAAFVPILSPPRQGRLVRLRSPPASCSHA
mmetsp:Transcript_6979/g.15946  ORF Transcript_6979/g.15946 Transcript_6979/m.15946 type:complete len:257 (-) Transcript_6979:421-1191(-)